MPYYDGEMQGFLTIEHLGVCRGRHLNRSVWWFCRSPKGDDTRTIDSYEAKQSGRESYVSDVIRAFYGNG